jgi:aspartate ammonia-lyase
MKKNYYAQQTEQALKNFPFSLPPVRREFIFAIAAIKEAAAEAHVVTGDFSKEISNAIIQASREVRQGKFVDQFFLPFLQGGAGTSINMNVNEVIATRATELLHGKYPIHPNDHVNKSQSTNDVGPSSLKIACLPLLVSLVKTLDEASESFMKKAHEYSQVAKLGRTHLQDAVPTTIGEEFSSYAATIFRGNMRLKRMLPDLYELNLGGTAIGNAVNASDQYRHEVYKALCRITHLPVTPATNLMSQTSSQTDFVSLSQAIVAVMVDLSKIASDFRLLASGPVGGLGEIRLKELQSGSSIMPGKINPIMPEALNQAYFFVSGNNVTIEHAAQASQLELGVMFPVLVDRLLASLTVAQEVVHSFTKKCVDVLLVDESRCQDLLVHSTAYATLLTPRLGYDVVSRIVKETRQTGNGQRLQEALRKEKIS